MRAPAGAGANPICPFIVFYFRQNYKGKKFWKVGGGPLYFGTEACKLRTTDPEELEKGGFGL